MDFDPFVTSTAFGPLTPRRKADPSRELVAAFPSRLNDPKQMHSLLPGCDELSRTFGPRLWRAMLTDPAVSSSYRGLQWSILDGGIHLKPSHPTPAAIRAQMVFGQSKPDSKPTDPAKAEPKAGMSPEQSRSDEICEFDKRLLERISATLNETGVGLLNAMGFGVKLAEPTLSPILSGPDKGKLGIGTFRVKPDWAWRFVVDRALNVTGILTFDDSRGQYVVFDPSKFTWLTWLPEDNDPRGSSILRAAYDAWNAKIQQIPSYHKFLTRFGTPGIHGTLPENPASGPDVDPVTGEDEANTQVDPATRMLKLLQFYQGGGVVVTPFGSTIAPFEPQSNGEALLSAFDLFDRQICLAIQLQARTSLEAKHGSKADTDNAGDTRAIVVRYGREVYANAIRKMLKFVNEVNFGVEDADQFTPTVTIGQAEVRDKPVLWGAAASLVTSGYLGESQKAELDEQLGLPMRDAETDARMAEQKMQMQADLAAKSKQPPGNQQPPPKGAAK